MSAENLLSLILQVSVVSKYVLSYSHNISIYLHSVIASDLQNLVLHLHSLLHRNLWNFWSKIKVLTSLLLVMRKATLYVKWRKRTELCNSLPTKGVSSEKAFPRLCPAVDTSQSLVDDRMGYFYAPAKTMKSFSYFSLYFHKYQKIRWFWKERQTAACHSCEVAMMSN